jgi:hypothetical protein
MGELKIGQKFIGNLENQFKDKIIIISKLMLFDEENTLFFLHYNGFKLIS